MLHTANEVTVYEWYPKIRDVIDERLDTLSKDLEGLVLHDEQAVVKATELGVKLNTFEKDIEASRKEKVKPFNDAVDSINAFFKTYREKALALKKDVASKIDSYRSEQRRIAEQKAREEEERLKKERELQRRRELEAAKKNETPPPPIAPKVEPVVPVDFTPKSIRSEVGKATEKVTWKFEIVDANKLPREYLVPDETKIRKVVAAGVRDIAGVRIYEHRETVFGR